MNKAPQTMTLRNKLQALTAPCREVDAEIAVMFGTPVYRMAISGPHDAHGLPIPAFTESLDAVVDLVEREMPRNWLALEHAKDFATGGYSWVAKITSHFRGEHALPAVALLLALLEAKEATEEAV